MGANEQEIVEHEAEDILSRLKANPKVGIKNPGKMAQTNIQVYIVFFRKCIA